MNIFLWILLGAVIGSAFTFFGIEEYKKQEARDKREKDNDARITAIYNLLYEERKVKSDERVPKER